MTDWYKKEKKMSDKVSQRLVMSKVFKKRFDDWQENTTLLCLLTWNVFLFGGFFGVLFKSKTIFMVVLIFVVCTIIRCRQGNKKFGNYRGK